MASGFSAAHKLRAATKLCAAISAGDAVVATGGRFTLAASFPLFILASYNVPTSLWLQRAAPLGFTIPASRHPGCTTLQRWALVGGLALRGLQLMFSPSSAHAHTH